MHVYKFLRITAICMICIAFVAVALYFIPWPTRIDMEMSCSEVTQDGDVLTEGTFTLRGWQLNYLFKEDRITVESLTLPGYSASLESAQNTYLTLSEKIEPHAAFGVLSDGTGYPSIYISLEENWVTCLISLDGERYFACSLDNSSEIHEILEIHKWILD